jgi:hypothetical protein
MRRALLRLRAIVAMSVVPLAATIAASHVASAQGIAPKPLGPKTLSGVVVDDAGQPVADATVFVLSLRRRAQSGPDGTFRFDNVKNETYSVLARAPGHLHTAQEVKVGANGGSAYVRMTVVARPVLSLITKGERGGLRGVIADTAFVPLANVAVRAKNDNAATETDANGAFYLPLAPGSYAVELQRPGYARKVLGVTIDGDSGRKVAAWLEPRSDDAALVDSLLIVQQELRRTRGIALNGKVYTREDLEKLGLEHLQQLAAVAAQRAVSDDCAVQLGSTGDWIPGWMLAVRDIEFAEAYSISASMAMQRGTNAYDRSTANNRDNLRTPRTCTTVEVGAKRTAQKCTGGSSPGDNYNNPASTAMRYACPSWIVAWLRN